MADSVFREKSLKKISSPEELNDYIKVSKPSIWIVISAVLALLVGVFVWGIFGSLNTTVTAQGIASNGKITCYISDPSGIDEGKQVNVGDTTGTVKSVSATPLSKADATAAANTDDYTLYCLGLSDWNYVVEIEAKEYDSDGLAQVSIVTDTVSPISFIWS